MMMYRICTVVVPAVFFFLSCRAVAETITVCAVGCDHTSINEAIDVANNGDIIQLSAESYQEGTVIDTQGKAITLLGATDKEGRPNSRLNGQNTHGVLQCVNNEGPGTVFENLVVQRGFSYNGGGMNISSTSPSTGPTLRNCLFANNTATWRGGGIHNASLSANVAPSVINCTFAHNHAGNTGGGMTNINSSPTLTNCTFLGNTAENDGGGIDNMFETILTLINCRFEENLPNDFDGMIASATFAPTVTGDIDGDGDYDEDDVRLAMAEFSIIEAGPCPSDINGDGQVDGQDLAALLAAWGLPCDG
ncbi:MAG: hypothetical protein CMJ53_08320 [Planctomycetaceae bacterium]|nr:hypothetical protein [Planctomycetaceae bacterium]